MNKFIVKAANAFGLIDFGIDIVGNFQNQYRDKLKVLKESGVMELPTNMTLIPTKGCNLNCIQCHQKGRIKEQRKELSYKDIIKVIDNSGDIKSMIVVGGEIFTRKDIIDILNYIDEKNINLKISTNGYKLSEDNIYRVHYLKNVSSVAFSLDGPELIHNAIRGRSDAFQETLKAIKLFKFLGHKILVSCVIMPKNIDYIEDVLKICYNIGVDRLTFIPVMYKTNLDQNATEFNINLQKIDYSKQLVTNEQLLKAKKLSDNYRTKGFLSVFNPPIRRNVNTVICKSMFILQVGEYGDVFPCSFLDKKFGNIVETPIAKIWNSPELCAWRRDFVNGNQLPTCKTCCASIKL